VLEGANPQELTVGDAYVELGATATDDTDDDTTLTAAIVIDATAVDTTTAGSYSVTYNVSDAAGNAATEVTRTVTVEAATVSGPPCTHTLVMNDQYNDTWDGASVDILVNGTVVASTTGPANGVADDTLTFDAASGDTIALGNWSSGSYDSEISWELLDGEGSSLGSGGFGDGTAGLTAYCTPPPPCPHTLVMNDQYNDTWDGASVDILVNGTVVASTTGPANGVADDTLAFDAASGDTIALGNWSSGSYDSEISWAILDGAGTEIAAGGFGDGTTEVTGYCPSCLDPTDLAVSDVTTITASVTWTANNGETAWEYQVVAGGDTPAETGTATSDNPLALTGLIANTAYDVYVRANCGDGVTSAWVMVSFTTECDAVTAFPYTEDFDSDWSCWSVVNGDGDSYTWSQSATYITPRSGSFTAHGMGSNNDYLISPKFTLTGNERVVWYDIVESTTRNNTYDVLLSTTGKEISDFTVNLGTYDCTNVTWTEHILDLSAYSGDVYIALHQTYSASTVYGFGVDDFTIMENPSCISPTDLSASGITTTGAVVSWVSDGTAFLIEIQPEGSLPGTPGGYVIGDVDPYPTTSVDLTGYLTPDTSYDIYVTNVCDGGNSEPAGPLTFTTSCVSYSIPYFEGFESGYTHASSVGGCLSQESIAGTGTWAANNTLTTYNRTPRTGDWNAYVGYGNEDWLFISVDLTADMSYTASVHARQDGSTASNSDITISYGASASAAAMTNTIVPATGIVNGDYQLISGAFTPTTSGTHVIGIKGYMNTSPWYISIDDISIDLSPDCLMPTDLAVADVTTTTASVSWTANSGESAWEYQVVESGVAPDATGDTTSDNPLELTLLTANTTYDVYVRANCGTDGTSEWASVSFTTLPAPIVPDYTNDFTTFPGEFWTTDTGVLNTSGGWGADGFANNGTTGAAKINIYTSSFSGPMADDSLISPSFDLSGGTYYLNMIAALTPWNGTSDGAFGEGDYVSVSVTEDAGETWVELFRWDSTNAPTAAGDAMPELDLSSYASSSVQIKIFAQSGTEVVDNDFFIDDFSVTSSSLGLEDVNTSSNFTYFPNPVNNVLSIKAQASIDSITVYNMLGQTVVRSTPNTTTTAVDMSGLQTGAYFVQLAINNSIETVRVIKN
jgi:hypothetical protein